METQRFAEQRIPVLLEAAGPGTVTFLSCEPLLEELDLRLTDYTDPDAINPVTGHKNCGGCSGYPGIAHEPACCKGPGEWSGISWVIAGGESGRKARITEPDWVRSLRNQCVAAGVPFLFKQWGEWAPAGMSVGHLSDQRERHVGGIIRDPNHPDIPWRQLMRRVGKKAAGRLLDGRTWDEYPAVTR